MQSGGWKSSVQDRGDLVYGRSIEITRSRDQIRDPARAIDRDLADPQPPEDRQALHFCHAERPGYGDVGPTFVGEDDFDELDLTLDGLDEVRPTAPVDIEVEFALREEAAVPVDSDLPAQLLRVDDGDATGPDGNVVEVRAPPGEAAVVQEDDRLAGEALLEALGVLQLAGGALCPCLLVLRPSRHSRCPAADAAIAFPLAVFPPLAAALVRLARARAGPRRRQRCGLASGLHAAVDAE